MEQPIRNVSDTALWVAMYRALESERPDALFSDPFARRLAGERGVAIHASMRRQHMDWPIVVRTQVIDELVQRAVQAGCRTVLNLACGLDARAFRLPLPATLRWIDADLPGIVDYRQQQLAGERLHCEHTTVAVDLADAAARRQLFADAGRHGPALVLSEGLLLYLEPAAVTALAQDLHAEPGLQWWVFDLASPELLAMLRRRLGTRMQSAELRFAPPEGTGFFAAAGWREVEWRSTWDESLRLRRTLRLAWFWQLLFRLAPKRRRERMRRFSGIALLQRS